MKFSTFTTLLIVFFGLVASVPVADVEPSGIESRDIATIYPSLVVQIYPNGGTVSDYVAVFRPISNGIQYDTSSLLAYTFSRGYPGKTCSFSFKNGLYTWGTPQVELFSLGGRPISSTDTSSNRPPRDKFYDTFTISFTAATATWSGQTPTFPCPASPTTLNFEVAPHGVTVAVWQKTAGLAIVVL